jgi:bifunctional non-homologous end joining protein LigD
LFAHACKLGFEGIISKKANAPYRSERGDAWVKIKCVQRAKFPVVGFVKDPTGVAALHLAKKVGLELTYVGKVGTGGRAQFQAGFGNNSKRWSVPNRC